MCEKFPNDQNALVITKETHPLEETNNYIALVSLSHAYKQTPQSQNIPDLVLPPNPR